MASKYKNDTSIVFISISSMDDPEQLYFAKTHWDMEYQLVASRFDICKAFNIKEYPTNLILYQNKVLFKSIGYYPNIDKKLVQVISSINK